MSFRQRLGLDPTTTKELSTFLGGKDGLNESLFLNMRGDIRTTELANALMFFSVVGHEDIFNSDVARVVRDQLLSMSIGFKGKRAELVAAVMSMGNIQNERRVPTGHFEFTDGAKQEKD